MLSSGEADHSSARHVKPFEPPQTAQQWLSGVVRVRSSHSMTRHAFYLRVNIRPRTHRSLSESG